jgi:hypothetical protein
MSDLVAPQVSTTLNGTSSVISPDPIRVYAVQVNRNGIGQRTVRFVDNLTDLNDYFVLRIQGNSTEVVTTPFLADSGFAWTSNAALDVTIFHAGA